MGIINGMRRLRSWEWRTLPSSFPTAWAHLISQPASDCSWETSHLGGGTVPAAQGLGSSPAPAHGCFSQSPSCPQGCQPQLAVPCAEEREQHPQPLGDVVPACPANTHKPPREEQEHSREGHSHAKPQGGARRGVCRNSAALGQIASGTDSGRITHTGNYQQATPQESTNPSAWPCTGLGCSWGLFML